MNIKENIDYILEQLPKGVTLVAVSKTKPIELMEEAYKCGIKDFAENKVQELLEKHENFHSDVKWHFIGHLQTNKVKYLVGKVHLIHSLDSVKLLNQIEKSFGKANEVANVLIQINIGREATKSGMLVEDLSEFISALESCEFVKARGLMVIIPKGNEQSNRYYFQKTKKIYEDLKNTSYKNFCMEILSMGMTNDFKIAVEEGSNMVRVGEGIFGKRI
ncbi:YggS family pyridoxal phosphate enzyme [Clostridium polyendosporum]|uniref:Pyridoxal phosphate homeostasis protein n=1 Tax=Clostridium polyendosporum TaxID=69208 RepID=A0A919VKW2_9CLOT|nr:YggS family pyridoxal phosphate-dependent enzyme [Clostridium polyendosporum]GIM27978.1 YggS family pyridoxal phosphate enzyme [Clostridium polyendosporum]